MAPIPTLEEGGKASGSRSRAGRRRPLRRIPAPRSTPTVTTRSRAAQSEAAPSWQRGKRKPAKEQFKRRKRARATDKSCQDEKKAGNTGELETAVAASASPGAEQASSSAISSPLRWPYIPVVKGHGCEILETCDPAIEDAYDKLKMKYYAKRDRQLKLVTFDQNVPHSCLVNQNLLPARESATKTVLQTAKVVLALSSYVDGRLLTRCSAFLIDWDDESRAGMVLTSALLIRSKSLSPDQWLGTDEYAPDAEVRAHLLDKDETTVAALLLHYDKHFNIALFKIAIDLRAKIPSFSSEVMYGQDVLVLGRDEGLNLKIDHGSIQYMDPEKFQRYHYMFMDCVIDQCGMGGPVIDFNGQILGVANIPGMGFIPSSIILKCLDMWKKFHCVPRLHIGLKFSAIKFLDPAHVEKISRVCNIDSGLIVEEVSKGSVAEKLGVRVGDIIECLNGVCTATTVELENLLMRTCEDHLDRRGGIGSFLDVPVGIFHTRKGSSCTKNLRVYVSDDIEVFAKGDYLVSARDCA